MTLIEQFPDVSMLIREKKKLDLKYHGAQLFKNIQYKPMSFDQAFYDKEFKTWHYKLFICLGLIITGAFYVVLNLRSILNWMVS